MMNSVIMPVHNIHPTAIVHPNAKIGKNVEIGPYAVVGDDVVIGDGCKLSATAANFTRMPLSMNTPRLAKTVCSSRAALSAQFRRI